MSDIDLRNGVRVTVKAPAPRFTASAPSSTVAVLPVRGPAGADGTGGTGGGVSDHGALTGLADDDHPHYALADGTRGNFAATGHAHTYTAADVGAEPAGAVAAHSADTTAVHGIADTAALVVTTDPRLSDARAPTAHTHPTAEVTGLDTALAGKADDGHLHDDRYYTETEVDTALAGKAAASHNHVAADVTDLGTAATKDTPATGDALAGQVVVGSDTRLSDARTPTAHTHPSGEVTGLAAVATSGAYIDLTGKPTIPDSPDDIGAAPAAHTHPATGVTFTPSGDLAATDVQAALAELDAEKETPAGAQAKVDAHAGATDPHGDRTYADATFIKAGQAAKAVVNTFETTTTAFTSATAATTGDLATPGPTVTRDVPASGQVMVVIQAWARNTVAGKQAYLAFAMSGANTAAGNLDDAVVWDQDSADYSTISGVFVMAGLAVGSTTFTAKYWTEDGGTAYFGRRQLSVIPI